MKLLLLLLMAATAHAAVPLSDDPDIIRVADCIAAVESGRDDMKQGPCGEQGRHQFTRTAWEEEFPSWFPPFELAQDGQKSTMVAEHRLHRMTVRLRAKKIEPTPYALACCWKLGFDGAVRAIRHGELCEPAERVANLYNSP